MPGKDIYRELQTKQGREEGSNSFDVLVKEIREIRDELDERVAEKDAVLTSAEILKLSRKLDELIVKYFR